MDEQFPGDLTKFQSSLDSSLAVHGNVGQQLGNGCGVHMSSVWLYYQHIAKLNIFSTL